LVLIDSVHSQNKGGFPTAAISGLAHETPDCGTDGGKRVRLLASRLLRVTLLAP